MTTSFSTITLAGVGRETGEKVFKLLLLSGVETTFAIVEALAVVD